ncbi:MAG: fumarate reductase cytochrome b subunit [Campylobacterota bacterium]|nr:fumarate reductase cytochrome b subunit [Campylobacterota bacterium]
MRHDRVHKSIAAYMRRHISHKPARLDLIQSVTGLILAIFIAGHLLFEASILISKDAMYAVTRMFEGYYFFGETYPGIITFLAGAIFVIFIVHALTAVRKLPSSYRQYSIYKKHMSGMQHSDTSLWFYQAVTGFMMFFLGSVHLYMMMSTPDKIGPYASADRIYSEWMWPLYLLLLISVILHAAIGLYRLALKWGVFEGKDPKKSRKLMKKIMIISIVLYMGISLLSLGTYMMIGHKHADKVGERYHPVKEPGQ